MLTDLSHLEAAVRRYASTKRFPAHAKLRLTVEVIDGREAEEMVRVTVLPGEPERELNETERTILLALFTGGPCKRSELAKRCGYASEASLRSGNGKRGLPSLISDEFVVNEADGFDLTDAGLKEARRLG